MDSPSRTKLDKLRTTDTCMSSSREKHGRIMLDSIDNGPLVYLTVEENGQTRPMKYSKLTEAQQLQDECDVQATNIILHGLPPDVYALNNHQETAKDIWDRLINDMHTIGMTMQQVQVNTKFLNALLLEWSKFVTDVKLAKNLYTTNYDQLYAYLSQHERHANEVRITHERYPDPLALVANSPTLYNPSQSPQHSGYIPDAFLLKQDRVSIKKLLCESLMVFIRHHDHFIKTAGDKRVITAGNDGCILYGHGYCYKQIQEAEGITMNKVAMIDFRNKQVVTCFHGHVTAAGGIVFEMEDCSWLYGVYEETAGVINMGLMMVRLMFIDCGSDIDSCSDEDV
ncbi:hypothetical protein Tco_0788850 [Tanacetum coccineum]